MVYSATKNHVNLLKSLATRHQGLQAYHLLSPNYFNELEKGSQDSKIERSLVNYVEMIMEKNRLFKIVFLIG